MPVLHENRGEELSPKIDNPYSSKLEPQQWIGNKKSKASGVEKESSRSIEEWQKERWDL